MKKKFFVLWSIGMLCTLVALPYIFALQHEVIEKATMPMPLLILISLIQSGIILAIAVFLGLRLSEAIRLPALTLLSPTASFKEEAKRISILAVPLGIAVGLGIKFGDLLFSHSLPELVAADNAIPFWKTLLVAPYGGFVEEILMRLFIVSLLAWLLGSITRTVDVVKSSVIMWTAILITAVLFGLGHLPATATIVPITGIVVLRAILLNGIGGVIFGWLYWKKGLEYAIIAHFTADIVLHALLPLLA